MRQSIIRHLICHLGCLCVLTTVLVVTPISSLNEALGQSPARRPAARKPATPKPTARKPAAKRPVARKPTNRQQAVENQDAESEGPVLSPKITTGLRRNYSDDEMSLLQGQLSNIEQKIAVTASEIKRVRDSEFLPDLYFSLADLHLQKSRLMYMIKVNKNKGVPLSEIDFTAEKRPKQEAIDIYQKVYAFFPKSKLRDRALFFKALELRDIGQSEEMIKAFGQLRQEFPESTHLLEANIILGDYFLEEKKDIEGALEAFRRVLSRELSAYTPLAHYRIGWCLINQQKYDLAVTSFEEAIRTQGLISKNLSDQLPELYRKTDIRREAVLSMAVPYVEIYGDYRAKAKEEEELAKKAAAEMGTGVDAVLPPSKDAPLRLPAKANTTTEKVSAWVRPGGVDSEKVDSEKTEAEIEVVEKAPLKPVIHPVDYFRGISDSHQTYRRVLARVGRRLALKEMWREVAEVWMEVLVANSDPEIKFEAIQRWNEATKKVPVQTERLLFIEHAV
ncbi:MAG: tetratricopeptide repeat protein, partial [Bdellovibrionales bacterium]|nr:tetratricopeptide repeat protein [Bdellovibrionales bacterium]